MRNADILFGKLREIFNEKNAEKKSAFPHINLRNFFKINEKIIKIRFFFYFYFGLKIYLKVKFILFYYRNHSQIDQ